MLTRYYGVAHPSLPNYLALVSGSTHGIRTDCTTCFVAGPSVADSIEAAGRSWKVYAEDLPSPGFAGPWSGGYARKHNPFMYFRDVAGDRARRSRIVPFAQLARDVRAQELPDFALVVPNLCHSMHDCSVGVGDAWLRRTTGS
jgi:phosphatidylinositol-3-phosphatase